MSSIRVPPSELDPSEGWHDPALPPSPDARDPGPRDVAPFVVDGRDPSRDYALTPDERLGWMEAQHDVMKGRPWQPPTPRVRMSIQEHSEYRAAIGDLRRIRGILASPNKARLDYGPEIAHIVGILATRLDAADLERIEVAKARLAGDNSINAYLKTVERLADAAVPIVTT